MGILCICCWCVEDMSRHAPSALVPQSLLPPPSPSPSFPPPLLLPPSPSPSLKQPRDEWVHQLLHKLTQFNIRYFRDDPSTSYAVQQLQDRQHLSLYTIIAPAYPRFVRIFYQNMYEEPMVSSPNLCSTIDDHEITITPSMIARALNFHEGYPTDYPFPDIKDNTPIPRLIQEFFLGAHGDNSFTYLHCSNLPTHLLFIDSMLHKNALPLGHKVKHRKETTIRLIFSTFGGTCANS